MATTDSQSSVAGQAEQSDNFNIDVASPLWRHTTRSSQVFGGGSYIWKCNVCHSKPFNNSYSRVKAHFMGSAGKGITLCKGSKDGKRLSDAQLAGIIKEQEAANRLMSKSKTSLYKPSSTKSKVNVPTDHVASSKHPFLEVGEEDDEVEVITRKRGPLDQAFQMEVREIVDEAIARCLYANGLPFNLVRSPYWKEMVATILRVPIDYIRPGFEKVHATLLQKEKISIEKALQPIRTSWKTFGITIVSDGWKDTRNQPLINVIAISPKAAMFLRAIDCEGQVKDSQFISRILIEAVEMVGSENVV